MKDRPLLESARRTEEVSQKIAAFHAETVREVADTVSKEAVVVVGMAQNPHVKRVRQALDDAKIKISYLEYGNYFGQWRRRLAIKLWSGWPTFPQVFVGGVLVGGEAETRAALADGSLKTRLEGLGKHE